MELTPLKLHPCYKDYLWGGERLRRDYHKADAPDITAESWELAQRPEGVSTVESGPLAGMTPDRLAALDRDAFWGTRCAGMRDFPLLVKLIDARRDLSIQVHPDNAYALKNEHQYGKTEMWYVVDCEEGAYLYYGFNREVSKEEFAERIKNNTLLEVLNPVKVKKGDVLFIESGTIHAIGKNILIAEIQQNSNVTYRIYDYDRPGPDGKPRELHTELAKEAIDYTVPDDYRTHYERIRNKDTELVACPYFTTHLCDATFSVLCDYSALDSFVVLIFVAGAGELVDSEGNRVAVQQGETVLIPASTRQVTLLPGHGGLRFLSSYIETPEE